MRYVLLAGVALLCWLAAGRPAEAYRAVFLEKELIGRADIVAVATVQAVADAPHNRIWDRMLAVQLTLRIDEMLKGAVETAEVTARCRLISKAGLMKPADAFTAGQQRLFFLQHGPDGYWVQNDLDTILPASDARRIAQLIAQNPLVVTLAKASAITLEQLQEIPVQVANRGTERIEVYGYVEGFFVQPSAGTWLGFDQEVEQQCLRIRLTLEPGQEQTLRLICRARQHSLPAGATADAAALLSAVIRMSDYHNNFHMSSEWVPVTVHPLPAQ